MRPTVPEPAAEYTPRQRAALLGFGRASILHGMATGEPSLPDAGLLDDGLAEPRASFVTLTRDGTLRGCTGSLEAAYPLAIDVARSAFRSAFHDFRFPPLSAAEVDRIEVEVSVLSPLTRIEVSSEEALLERLRPGVDGLVIALGANRATFLPKVWESLPERRDFLSALQRKAGIPAGFWPARMQAYRYHTETFSEP